MSGPLKPSLGPRTAGFHCWSGQLDPSLNRDSLPFRTFSVSVFQWLPRASGQGVKRGPCKVRVRGSYHDPDRVYNEATRIALELDAGSYSGPRIVTVKEEGSS